VELLHQLHAPVLERLDPGGRPVLRLGVQGQQEGRRRRASAAPSRRQELPGRAQAKAPGHGERQRRAPRRERRQPPLLNPLRVIAGPHAVGEHDEDHAFLLQRRGHFGMSASELAVDRGEGERARREMDGWMVLGLCLVWAWYMTGPDGGNRGGCADGGRVGDSRLVGGNQDSGSCVERDGFHHGDPVVTHVAPRHDS
jgi:hypothetical protein